MSNTIVSNVYRYVIDEVINQVRGDFEDMGIDESILQELQRSWETKVARSRVANFGFKENGYYEDEHRVDPNVNNGGLLASVNSDHQLQYPSEYSSHVPPSGNLANLAMQNRSLPPPQQQQQQQQQIQSPYGMPPINGNNRMIPDPNMLMNQYQMMQNSKPPQNNSLSDLQLPKPNIPQNDGGNDLTTQEIDRHIEDIIQSSQQEEKDDEQIVFTASLSSGEPLALDSLPDHVKHLLKDARQRAIKAGALSKQRRLPQLDGEDDEDEKEQTENNEDDINSDLDDTDEDDEDGEGGDDFEHIILCLYDKVSRTKNKWKCTLRDGIMLINGRDYLFQRANGDFEW